MGKRMYLTLGPSSSCEHTLFCLNQDGNSVTERSRVASQTLPALPRGCAQSWHSALSTFSHGRGGWGSAFQHACEDTGPATSLSSLVTGMHQCPPALWRLKSPSSLPRVSACQGIGQGWGTDGRNAGLTAHLGVI